MESTNIPKACPFALTELETYLKPFTDLLRRPESRLSLERYVTGLLTDLGRKNCDTIAAAVAGTSSERLQHLLTDAPWDATAMNRERVRGLIGMTPAKGVLILDDTGLAKKGKSSVGVQEQYSGTLGGVGNCQVVVSSEYTVDEPSSSTPLHWPVNFRLYLPESWASDPKRRERAHVPDEVEFQKKWQIGLALVDEAREWAVPFAYVVADAWYGKQNDFLDGLEERGVQYVCGVDRPFGLRLPEEVRAAGMAPIAQHQGRGRPKGPRLAPLYKAESLIKALPQEAWHAISWRDGTKKQLCKQFVAVRVHRATGNPANRFGPKHPRVFTGPEGWLLGEQPLDGEEGDSKYYYSNLPADTPLERLVELAHSRWVIEQFYEDSKGECGLDDFQGRRWDGLHRHLTMVALAYSFLMTQRAGEAGHDGGDAFSPLQEKAIAT